MKIIANLSNHHIHLSKKHLDILFGKDHKLTRIKDLYQPSQFVAKETVELIGMNNKSIQLRIIGPVRENTQCEILQSDVHKLGFSGLLIKKSGEIDNSNSFKIIGPNGLINLKEEIIIPQRHVHIDEKTAQEFNLLNQQTVSIKTGIYGKRITFHDVLIKISDNSVPECHFDFDEGNAAGIVNGTIVEILKNNQN